MGAFTPIPAATDTHFISGALKIGVREEGLYQISSVDIKKRLPAWEHVDPANVQLTLHGQEQPIWITTQGEAFQLVFYGMPSESRYTEENIYLLTGSAGEAGLRMEVERLLQTHTSPTHIFTAKVHVEENKIYAPQVIDGDHLFWYSVPGKKTQDITLNLEHIADGDGHIRVALWGSTESPVVNDHHVLISINGQVFVDQTWDGIGRQTLAGNIPAGVLQNGQNVVTISVPGDTTAAAEINYVDWIEIDYPRQADAEDDILAFDIPSVMAGVPLQLRGFREPVVIFDVTVPTDTRAYVNDRDEAEIFFAGEVGHRYLAVGSKGWAKPASLTPITGEPDLRALGTGADYVAIGPAALLPPLSPLLDWRGSQGFRVMSIPLEAVYDQFNHGMPEPEAIRAFMAYAAESWHPAPRYLLLIGDATYDPRGYISAPEANRLPVFFTQTNFGGETASDLLLGDVNGDQLPDLAIGRVPAQNENQVRVFVEKTLAYEQSTTAGDWSARVLAIADGQEASFKSDAQVFLNELTAPYRGVLYAPEAGVENAAEQISTYLVEGYGLMVYFGHGSINMWGKDRIFHADDVNQLSNINRLPVIINMTCLTGFFIHPKVASLTEAFLFHAGGGAVAMLAPTSLTLPMSQSYLRQALVEEMMKRPAAVLGDIFLQAQRQVPVSDAGAQEVLMTFLLFGDPALHMGVK